MSWSAILLEDDLRHPWKQLHACWRLFFMCPLHNRYRSLLQHFFHAIFRGNHLHKEDKWRSEGLRKLIMPLVRIWGGWLTVCVASTSELF